MSNAKNYVKLANDSKFTVAGFNKLYLSILDDNIDVKSAKKEAKIYLQKLVEEMSLSRIKSTIYGAGLMTKIEYDLTTKVKYLENQIASLKSEIKEIKNNSNVEVVEEVVEEVEEVVEVVEEVEEVVEEVVEVVEEVVEVVEEVEEVVEVVEEVVEVVEEVEEVVEVVEEVIDVDFTLFLQNYNKMISDGKFNVEFLEKLFFDNLDKLLEQKLSIDIDIINKIYINIKLAKIYYNGVSSKDLGENVIKIIMEEEKESLMWYINADEDYNKNLNISMKEFALMEVEISQMKNEDKLSNILKEETEQEEERKFIETEDERKDREAEEKFASEYLLDEKVETEEYNFGSFTRKFKIGNDMVDAEVKFGDNNLYSYNGKLYKKFKDFYLELDSKKNTTKSELELMKNHKKITWRLYQEMTSLDLSYCWTLAFDRQNYITYEIFDIEDYFSIDEMLKYTENNSYWVMKKEKMNV